MATLAVDSDIEVVIDGEPGKYVVRSRASSGEEWVGEFLLPYEGVELNALLALVASPEERRSGSGKALDAARTVGSRLFHATSGGIPDSEALRRAGSGEGDARLRLRLPAELEAHPWELLYDERRSDFLMRHGLSIVRGGNGPPALVEPRREPRPLIVEASPPELPAINGDRELKALGDLMESSGTAVNVLTDASPADLENAVYEFRPTMLHLAIPVTTRDREPAFGLMGDAGSVHLVTERELGDLLTSVEPLDLVVFGGGGAAAGLGHHLLRMGIRATVSLQLALDAHTAMVFATSLYEELMTGQRIDAAVAQTRRRLEPEKDVLAWAAPVLHSSGSFAPVRDDQLPTPRVPPRPQERRRRAEKPASSETEPQDTPVPESEDEEASAEPVIDRAVRIGTLGGAGNDMVGDEDQLAFRHYVNAFADLITSPHTTPPLTIGVFGSWGMGKSFLLEHIDREIRMRQVRGPDGTLRVHVLRFNAWEYSATELVWPGLVRKILAKLDEDVPWPRHKRLWTRLKWNLPRELRRLWAPLVAVALVVAVAIGAALVNDRTGLAAAAAGVVGALGVGGLLKAANNSVARWVTALFADSDYGRKIGYMEDIKHDLESLEGRLHEHGNPRGPVTNRILVLIDDLDRCEPEKAVEVLQAVNLLLNFKSFIVCLGIDARIVTGAVEKHYEGLLGRAGASGYEYLDKIVQIPFRIPEPNEEEIKVFLSRQLGDPQEEPDPALWTAILEDVASAAAEGPEAANAEPSVDEAGRSRDVTDVRGSADRTRGERAAQEAGPARGREAEPDSVPPASEVSAIADRPHPAEDAAPTEAAIAFTHEELEAFQSLAPFLRPNPRHLKRLVNVYRLVRALARAKQEQLILSDPATTIGWLVMWSQWPYTAHAMLERFEQLEDEWRGKPNASPPAGEPLLHLFDSVSGRLDVETRQRLDDEPQVLRELLAAAQSSLTWNDLRVMRKYTLNFNPAVEEQLRDSGAVSTVTVGP